VLDALEHGDADAALARLHAQSDAMVAEAVGCAGHRRTAGA
jgi:hypothetical protein